MLRFSCPSCKAVLETSEAHAGSKMACGRCGQRLQAPTPPVNKTVLGVPLPPKSSRSVSSSKPAACKIACPACGGLFTGKGNFGGRNARCPRCRCLLSFSGDGIPSVARDKTIADRPMDRRRPAWQPYIFGLMALLLGTAAVPSALGASINLLLPVLAGIGLLFGLYAIGVSAVRGGRGISVPAIGVVACCTSLVIGLVIFGGVSGLLRPAEVKTAAAEPKDAPMGNNPAHADVPKSDKQPTDDKKPKPDPLAMLVSTLESGDNAAKVHAAEELGKMGAAAKPAARALCKAATDPAQDVSQAAVEAMEKVCPQLVKPVVTLTHDKEPSNHIAASVEIGKMGEAAKPAIPVLIWHCREGFRKVVQRQGGGQEEYQVLSTDLASLTTIGLDDPDSLQAVIELATMSLDAAAASDRATADQPVPAFSYFGNPANVQLALAWDVKTKALIALSKVSSASNEARSALVLRFPRLMADMEKDPPYEEKKVISSAFAALFAIGGTTAETVEVITTIANSSPTNGSGAILKDRAIITLGTRSNVKGKLRSKIISCLASVLEGMEKKPLSIPKDNPRFGIPSPLAVQRYEILPKGQ